MSEQSSDSDARATPTRRRAPSFRARGTIGLFYVAGFFFLFSLLQVLPEMIELLGDVPINPAEERALEQAAQDAAHQGVNVYVSIALALGATGLGAWFQVLPGVREG